MSRRRKSFKDQPLDPGHHAICLEEMPVVGKPAWRFRADPRNYYRKGGGNTSNEEHCTPSIARNDQRTRYRGGGNPDSESRLIKHEYLATTVEANHFAEVGRRDGDFTTKADPLSEAGQ